jgi:hypothetical protein
MSNLTHAYYWEGVEVKPADYALMLEFDGVQHDLRLSTEDSARAVIEKLRKLAMRIERHA